MTKFEKIQALINTNRIVTRSTSMSRTSDFQNQRNEDLTRYAGEIVEEFYQKLKAQVQAYPYLTRHLIQIPINSEGNSFLGRYVRDEDRALLKAKIQALLLEEGFDKVHMTLVKEMFEFPFEIQRED